MHQVELESISDSIGAPVADPCFHVYDANGPRFIISKNRDVNRFELKLGIEKQKVELSSWAQTRQSRTTGWPRGFHFYRRSSLTLEFTLWSAACRCSQHVQATVNWQCISMTTVLAQNQFPLRSRQHWLASRAQCSTSMDENCGIQLQRNTLTETLTLLREKKAPVDKFTFMD